MDEKLKHFNLRLLLKYVAMAGVVSSFYPVILALRLLFFNTSGSWTDFLISGAILVWGLLAGVLVPIVKSRIAYTGNSDTSISIPDNPGRNIYRNLISIFIGIAAFAVPFAAAIAVYSREWTMRILFELLAAAVLYMLALRIRYHYTWILSRAILGTGIALVSLTLFATFQIPELAGLREMAFTSGYILLACAMVVRNQARLDNAFTKDERDINIPKSIRTYNTMILVLVLIFTVLLFNFKWIVIYLLKLAGFVVLAVIWLVNKFMSLFMFKQSLPIQMPPPPSNPVIQQGGSGNNILTIVMNVIVVLAALYAAYKFVRHICLALFRKILAKLSSSSDEIDDYEDEIEIIRPEDSGSGHKKFKKRSLKKELKKITDPVEKIRYLYHAIIEALINKDIDIQESDTTGEICMKAETAKAASDYVHNATAVYDKVRYGNEVPGSSEILQVEASYEKLVDALKKNS